MPLGPPLTNSSVRGAPEPQAPIAALPKAHNRMIFRSTGVSLWALQKLLFELGRLP